MKTETKEPDHDYKQELLNVFKIFNEYDHKVPFNVFIKQLSWMMNYMSNNTWQIFYLPYKYDEIDKDEVRRLIKDLVDNYL